MTLPRRHRREPLGTFPTVRFASLAAAAALGAIALPMAPPAAAGEIAVSGSVASELRWYPQSPKHSEQFSGLEPSLAINPTFVYETDDRRLQAVFAPFLRAAARDPERSHGDIREAYVSYRAGDWDYLVGLSEVFWGVTESRHLVNVINQTDVLEGVDEEDKYGQPMVMTGVQRDWGRVELFVLPGFRERVFPGDRGRLRTAKTVDNDAATFDTAAEDKHIDLAARYAHFIGDWDIGLSAFRGLSREPVLREADDGNRLNPHYDIITQAGADLQYTVDAWLWKFEGIVREGNGDAFAATTAGFEYTFFQIDESDADLGILLEGHYDGRDPATAPATAFDNDVFVGTRLVMNDVQDTSALIGAVVDVEDATTSLSLEFERRLGDTPLGDDWTLDVEARLLPHVDESNASAAIERDSFVTVTLSRNF